MMANVRAERLLKIPAEPSPELRIPGAAAQTRVVSMAAIRLGSWESARAFKGIICDDISEIAVGTRVSSHAPCPEPYVRFSRIRLVWEVLFQGSITPFFACFFAF